MTKFIVTSGRNFFAGREYFEDETMKKIVWTPEVIQAVKSAAVAVAIMWDRLREMEIANRCDFDKTMQMLGDGLAPECNHPPSTGDLTDEQVVEALDRLDREWWPE